MLPSENGDGEGGNKKLTYLMCWCQKEGPRGAGGKLRRDDQPRKGIRMLSGKLREGRGEWDGCLINQLADEPLLSVVK